MYWKLILYSVLCLFIFDYLIYSSNETEESSLDLLKNISKRISMFAASHKHLGDNIQKLCVTSKKK